MAKSVSVVAIIVVLVLLSLAQATELTKNTTSGVDEEKPLIPPGREPWRQRCDQQIKQQMGHIRGCRAYLTYITRPETQPGGGRGTAQQFLMDCCHGIKNMPEQCRCEAVERALNLQPGEFQFVRMNNMRTIASGRRGPPLEKKRDCKFEIGRGIRFLRYCECYLHIIKGAHDCGETGTPMIDIDPDVLYEIPCCETLQGMPEECRCGAVRAVLRMLQEDWPEEGMEEMKKLAKLPSMCLSRGPQQCQV
ncbi:OLC1v1012604C1 [Oldenlandia corymbosa var. corymbosa]|uniref:OLC1v1012604C1 n=1 Tax=Oldenlandia corymbosa var. corymbosa TaxID=529605 RepID=A0AAV1DYS4_OLDCO|nr:OLC1v1012604C1 [Oldenlandia corymbosa var. corymbosa]